MVLDKSKIDAESKTYTNILHLILFLFRSLLYHYIAFFLLYYTCNFVVLIITVKIFAILFHSKIGMLRRQFTRLCKGKKKTKFDPILNKRGSNLKGEILQRHWMRERCQLYRDVNILPLDKEFMTSQRKNF